MGTEMNAVDEGLRANHMRERGHCGDVVERPDGMRGSRTRDEASSLGKKRLQILYMKIAVLPHAPPHALGSGCLKREPRRDIGVVIHVGNHDLVALSQSLCDPDAHEPYERGGVHPKG